MSRQKEEQSHGQENASKVPLMICVAVIILLLVTVAILLSRGSGNTDTGVREAASSPKRDVVVNEENAESVAEEIINRESQEMAAPGTYQVTMNSTWNFPDGASPSENAYVENSTANTNPVYFDVQLADTEETIYKSPVIPVGSHLDNIKLDKDLDAGTYDCVLTYHLVDEEQNTLATLRMAVTVAVAN